jgi:hypothetical protein
VRSVINKTCSVSLSLCLGLGFFTCASCDSKGEDKGSYASKLGSTTVLMVEYPLPEPAQEQEKKK